jgi:hypothetical protein
MAKNYSVLEGTRLDSIANIDINTLTEYLTEVTRDTADVSFKGGKTARDTYLALKGLYLKDLIKLFKWLRVRGDQLQKPARSDQELAGLIGNSKFNLWSKGNTVGNSTLMIKILWSPIWSRICGKIHSPNLNGIDMSKITGLPNELKWPGYLAIVPVTAQYKGAIEFHTYFTQLYIKMRAKKRKVPVEEDTLLTRATKQAGFQKSLVRALSEKTKQIYFHSSSEKNDLKWEEPEFDSDAITDDHDAHIEDCITKCALMSKEDLYKYLTTRTMYGQII